MIVAVGSVRGAPGVTSWSLLLAAAWPSDVPRAVLEADPDGGVLGARYGLGIEPGAVTLLAALRRATDEIPVEEHARRCGDVWLVPGPETAQQARRMWTSTGGQGASAVAADDRVWLVDSGRAHPGSPVWPWVEAASLTVLVTGARHEDLVQIPSRVEEIPGTVALLVVGSTSYSTHELASFAGTVAAWQVNPVDDLPAQAGQLIVPSRARRSWLWRQTVDIAAAAAELAAPDNNTLGAVS